MEGIINKSLVIAKCREVLRNRLTEILASLKIAEEALVSDTKSSAGDKFETGREMAQQEISRNKVVLNDLNIQLNTLDKIEDLGSNGLNVSQGNLVLTNHGLFFLAVPLGIISLSDCTVMCISIHSPIGKLLINKTLEDTFEFNNKVFKIMFIS